MQHTGHRIKTPAQPNVLDTLRPRWPRVQTSALLGRFNLDVAKQDRAACFHDLGGANAAEDAINKTHAVDNCAGAMFLTRGAGVSIKSRTPAETLGWGPRPELERSGPQERVVENIQSPHERATARLRNRERSTHRIYCALRNRERESCRSSYLHFDSRRRCRC